MLSFFVLFGFFCVFGGRRLFGFGAGLVGSCREVLVRVSVTWMLVGMLSRFMCVEARSIAGCG